MRGVAATDATLLFRSLPRDLAADVFSFLDDSQQQLLLQEMTEQETRTLLAELSPDDRNAFDPEGVAVSEMKRTGYFALPVVTSLADISGVLIYLGIAAAIIGVA